MRKIIPVGCAALAAALGLGAGLIHMEKSAFSDALRSLADAAPEGVSIDADITASDFFSTDFSVRIGEAQENGFAARWNGRATFGLGTVVRATLDDRRDLGRLLPDLGIAGFRDKLRIEWAPWRSAMPVRWRTPGFDYLPAQAGGADLACTVEPAGFDGELKDGRFVKLAWTGEGFGCTAKNRSLFSLKDFAFAFSEMKAPQAAALEHLAPLYPVESSLRIGAFSGWGCDFKNIALSAKLEEASKPAAAAAERQSEAQSGQAAPLRWREILSGSVDSPAFENNILGERIALKLRIEGLTQDLADKIVGLNMALLAAGDETLLTAGAIKVLEDAFMRGGLALHLDDLSLEHKGERAAIAGTFAFLGDPQADRAAAYDPNRGVSLGSFTVSIPTSMLDAGAAAPFVSSGQLRVEDGAYRANVEISTVGIAANGVPVF